MDWIHATFVFLYVDETGDFAALPATVRAFAALILKFADRDEGFIAIASRETPTDAISRALRAHKSDRRAIAEATKALLDDGYLVVRDGRIYVRNWHAAQRVVPASAEERAAERRAAAERQARRRKRIREESAALTDVSRRDVDVTVTRDTDHESRVTDVGESQRDASRAQGRAGDAHAPTRPHAEGPFPSVAVVVANPEKIEDEPASLGARPTFGKAPHGGRTRAEKARDVNECTAFLLPRIERLGLADERDLRQWVSDVVDGLAIPADTPLLPLVRLALQPTLDEIGAQPAMLPAKRLGILRRQIGFKATDDKADGWRFARSDGRDGALCPQPRGRAGQTLGVDMAHELREMDRTESAQRSRRGTGESSAGDMFGAASRKGAA